MSIKNYIWDLDGTLLDSYKVITSSLYETYLEIGTKLNINDIYKYVIKYSVNEFYEYMKDEVNYPIEKLKIRYKEISESKMLEITLMKNAKIILEELNNKGYKNFVFTHRGNSTIPVLDNLGITKYFTEIVRSVDGFSRKPNPDGINYLVDKYDLNKEETCYVGDRKLDMECSSNANILGILYLDKSGVGAKTGLEDYVIYDLLDILNIGNENE